MHYHDKSLKATAYERNDFMRQIGFIPDPVDAKKFEDYLYTLGTEIRLDRFESGWNVWIFDEDMVPKGKAELFDYLKNPGAENYNSASLNAKKLRKKLEKEEVFVDFRPVVSHDVVQFPRFTFFLAILVLAVSIPMLLSDENRNHFVNILGLYWQGDGVFTSLAFSTQPWRLLTPVLLHFGPLHLLFNLLLLFEFGRLIEFQRGPWKYLAIFLIVALFSNLAQYLLGGISFKNGLSFGPASTFGGMSGVIYGFLAYAWIKGEFQPELGISIPSSTVKFMLFWLVLCWTGIMGPIANISHTSGLIIGLIIGLLPRRFTL